MDLAISGTAKKDNLSALPEESLYASGSNQHSHASAQFQRRRRIGHSSGRFRSKPHENRLEIVRDEGILKPGDPEIAPGHQEAPQEEQDGDCGERPSTRRGWRRRVHRFRLCERGWDR